MPPPTERQVGSLSARAILCVPGGEAMRILGWLASATGVAGVFVCNALAPLLWVVGSNLRSRAKDLMAIPEAGLEGALGLTGEAAGWLADASDGIARIKARADDLVGATADGPARAEDLAAAIEAFLAGPYATLRTVHASLRDRALAVSDVFEGIGRAVPLLAIAGTLAERLRTIDARMQEIDQTMTHLGQLGPTGLAEPGVAATVAERAVAAGERVEAIGALIGEVEAWLQESRQEVAAADRRIGRAVTLGALGGTFLCLFGAGLNVLLYQQGRRWSRR
jgi:hypothetical protein